MSEWIEFNLPWNVITYPKNVPYPSLDKEVREKFGFTKDELIEKFFPVKTGYAYDHPAFKEYNLISDEIEDTENKEEVLRALNNPNVNKVLDYRKLSREIDNFIYEHPDTITADEDNERINKEHKEKESKLSFVGAGLNKTGTVIEFMEKGKLTQLLIGNINEVGGVCNDCSGISDETIILRYKKVWENECVEKHGSCQV